MPDKVRGKSRYHDKGTGITVLILTLNEAMHIERCIRNVLPIADRIVVIDSGSTDGTQAISQQLGAEVVEHEFKTQAHQLNWALDNVGIQTPWTMRIDADEYLATELLEELPKRTAAAPPGVSALVLKRRVIFMGRWIRHGGIYPTYLIRVWRTGVARCEDRTMDEHMVLASGSTEVLRFDLVDENLRDLTWWTSKHNRYASREAAALQVPPTTDPRSLGSHTARSRRGKDAVYLRLPPAWRSWLYFIYRYVLRLGFLDGVEGLIFHTLQGLWYRLLSDAKLLEASRQVRRLDAGRETREPPPTVSE